MGRPAGRRLPAAPRALALALPLTRVQLAHVEAVIFVGAGLLSG